MNTVRSNTVQSNIDEILLDFFARQLEGKTGLRRKRIERVDASLRAFLEVEGHCILVEDDVVVLNAEREFRPADAFVHSMHADDLICALTLFVEAPYLAEDPTDCRVQLRTVDLLAGRIVGLRLINQYDMMCQLRQLRSAIDRAAPTPRAASARSHR